MAVNAALQMLSEEDKERIELLVVGTESSTDQGKPVGTFVHRFLGLPPNCRNFETKHACYGGMAALMTAAHWVASGVRPGKAALVIATDQSRAHFGVPWEFVMGAGAVAMLVSEHPKVLALDLASHGYWTSEVGDTFRPTSREEAGNTEDSVYCYLDALEGAFDDFEARNGGIDYGTWFARHVYHAPFGGMARRAHRMALRRGARISRKQADAHFDERVMPSLHYTRRMGGTYTASIFLGLMGLLDSDPTVRGGDRVSLFAYGSGSASELCSTTVGAEARSIVSRAGLEGLLAERRAIDVAEYEAVERQRTALIDQPTYDVPRDAWFERRYSGRSHLVLAGLHKFFRHYEWS